MTNILILGAGFGGIAAALKLEKKLGGNSDFKITLLDRNNFHLFTPALYEVATIYGLIEDNFNQYLRGSVAIPINKILKGKKINFVQAEIKEINLKDKNVATGGGAKLDFDYLIIALGGETEFYGIPGAREYAYNLKSIDDAVAIYKKLRDLYRTNSIDKTDGSYKIAVIGGGFTGVELAAELGCCVKNIIKACRLNKDCTKISLFDAGLTILPSINEKSRKVIEKRLKKLGVEVQTSSAVKEVGPDYIKIHPVKSAEGGAAKQQFDGVKDRGEVQNFNLIVWAGGIRGSRLLEGLNLKLTKKKTVEINEFLQAGNFDESVNGKIFAIGDSAGLIDLKNGRLAPAMAYVAHDQADIAAENIIRLIRRKPRRSDSSEVGAPTEASELKPYKLFYDAWIAPAGGKWAYFYYKGISIAGFIGYLLRQLVDFKYFLRILPLNKALALFFKDLVIFIKND